MPFTITCPTCRHHLTVHESASAYVANCPTCQNSLTVPPVAAHPEEPFAPPDESSAPRYKRKPSKSGSIGILGAVTVGLLLAGVAYFAIQGKANDVQEKQDHHRAVELEQYHQLLLERLAFEKRWGNQDSETEAYNTVLETEMEYANIIAKYPKWGKSAMRH